MSRVLTKKAKFFKAEIAYTVFKNQSKPWLVLLHGFLGSKEIWHQMIPHFMEDYQILCIDLPGHGKTTVLEDVIEMELCASVVLEVMDREKVGSAHFVGHSMGGYSLLEVMAVAPQRVLSGVLFNSTSKPDSAQKQADRLKAVRIFDMNPAVYVREAILNLFYEPNLVAHSEAINRLQEIALTTPVKGAQGCLRGMRIRKDFQTLVKNTTVPVLFLAGIHDTTVPYDTILEQVENSEIKLATLVNTGHMGFVEDLEESVFQIKEFISNKSIAK